MKSSDIKIEKDMSMNHIVYVWNLQWVSVSKHKYKEDAEDIYNAILNGDKKEGIEEIIKNKDSRCNVLISKYFNNW